MAPAQAAEYSEARVERLAAQLKASIAGEVRFDAGSRALYATDGSLYRQVPIGVVIPRNLDDVVATISACREHGAPVLARGAGTSLAGQCCNVAVVMDFSKYLNRVHSIDVDKRSARVDPGCVLDRLRDCAEEYKLTFAPDPSTHGHNTLGGMIGNNSCGVHSQMGGRTTDNIRSLDILTYDGLRLRVGPTSEHELESIIASGGRRGEIYEGLKKLRDRYAELIRQRFPNIPRRVSGYNLDELLPERGFNVARALVGSEGTCVTILSAEVALVPSPPYRALVVLGYDDVYACGDHINELLEFKPTGLEGMDSVLIQSMADKHMYPEHRQQLPEGGSWLLVEVGGDSEAEACAQAKRLIAAMKNKAQGCRLVSDAEEQESMWKVRESGLGATSRSPRFGATHEAWEDAAVPPENVGAYLRDFRHLLRRHDYKAALYGHFGQGCVHCRINFDLDSREGVQRWRSFMGEAADLVLSYGGSLSGEHGDGQLRGELLPRMYGPELTQAFREFRQLWDPHGKMNPGKVIDPFPITSNLRTGPEHEFPTTQFSTTDSAFAFPDDGNSFAAAAHRCVGIGNCRDYKDSVMCPSYRGSMEEKWSTRGRARLLFEMLKGDVIVEGWGSKAVRESLDMCLSCKACKRDCPVEVDMATLKAEFMFHHYKGRLRPRAAYAMGLIWWWSRLAAKVPRLSNFVLHAPGISWLLKTVGGIATERNLPPYATTTFREWFQSREDNPVPATGKRRVMLWPDTFSNYFYPNTLKAAVKVLEDAGCSVEIPSRNLCCGLPLFAEGMLDQAKAQLNDIMQTLAEAVVRGVPIVGVEPSCIASFRDELPELFPNDDRAHYLSRNTLLLSEYLCQIDYRPARLPRRALVHFHCHHHASLNVDAELEMLRRLDLNFQRAPLSCCGMAGSFGFKKESYNLSQKIAADKLLPALSKFDKDALLISNGFSCREQILQACGRESLNLAEVLELSLREGQPRLRVIASNRETVAT